MSATALAAAVAAREISPREVMAAHLERIDAVNPDIGAFLSVAADDAMSVAADRERDVVRGDPLGSLHGVPIAVKDIVDVEGQPTTCGSPGIRAGVVADRSASAVERLQAAGAIVVGKAHTMEFACVAHHPDTPPVRNPWALDHSPGGSSSGSGAAVAAGLVPLAIGTDTVGSIRIPAAWCGVVGFKPSWGAVPTDGVFPLAASLDHVGPIARDVGDAALMFALAAGVPTPTFPVEQGELRVGWDEAWATENVDEEVAAAAADAVAALRDAGATVVEVAVPRFEEWATVFAPIFGTEFPHAHRGLFPERRDDYGPTTRFLLELFSGFPIESHVEASNAARQFRRNTAALFDEISVLITPPVPTPAQPLPDDERGITIPDFGTGDFRYAMRFTALWDLAGFPAVSVPWSRRDNLPLAVQAIAGPNRDVDALAAAAAIEAMSPCGPGRIAGSH